GRTVSIRRACVRGHVGTTKTPESMATMRLIEQVMVPLVQWKKKCPTTQEGWVFPNERFRPTDPREFVRQVIKPILDAKGITWKGLYAGRRGGATAVVELTGGIVAAQEMLRHKSMATTAQFYKKQTTALASGLKLLEAASKNGNIVSTLATA